MKTFLYALGALALVTSTAAQADDAIKQQSESYAVQRGDYAADARADRDRSIANVQLRRELRDGDATAERAAAPRSDAWMFQSSRTDTVYGD